MSARREEALFVARVQEVIARLRASKGLTSFVELVPAELLNRVVTELGVVFREGVYTPVVTVWMFLTQVLSADHSCRDTVARLLAWRQARGQRLCSPNTGAYCVARGRLPEALGPRLVKETGQQLERNSAADWRWKGHRVRVVDGSMLTMPDTEENRAEYPQPSSQKPGLGFPIVRIVVVFSLAVGTVLNYALGPYRGKLTGENQLFRAMHDLLEPNDLVLADRYYASFWDFALLDQRNVRLVTRQHQLRTTDFRRGTRLGDGDHLVTWAKPKQRPDWMDRETYQRLPTELVLREVRVRVQQRGFRVREYVLVTTLLDHETYTADDLADLYLQRWQAELNLRSLKSAMQMDHLRCLTPEMVRKEIAMHLLGYNSVRRLMAEAARHHDLKPTDISFTGTMQTIRAFHEQGLLEHRPSVETVATLLAAIATHRVGDRPNRNEPRANKRRPKYKFLTKPRQSFPNRVPQKA
jgi:putative transposase